MGDDCLILLERIRQTSTDDVRLLCEQIFQDVEKWPKVARTS